ncbi:hypothetical protein Dimus_017830 [Dionaea muscipula]
MCSFIYFEGNTSPDMRSLYSLALKRQVVDGGYQAHELDLYLSTKQDEHKARTQHPGTYKKTLSLVIVDGFSVEISDDQAELLRSAKGVRVVEMNQEL